jgi:hypothetical protein
MLPRSTVMLYRLPIFKSFSFTSLASAYGALALPSGHFTLETREGLARADKPRSPQQGDKHAWRPTRAARPRMLPAPTASPAKAPIPNLAAPPPPPIPAFHGSTTFVFSSPIPGAVNT